MNRLLRIAPVVSLVVASLILLIALGSAASAQAWPQFRGPGASGVADGQQLPTRWNVETGENVRWKRAIPGIGHSSPIVWGDKIFVTTAVSGQDEELVLGDEGGIDLADDRTTFSWRLYCLSRDSGEVVWQKETYAGAPRATRHVKSSQANSTPATDGEVVVGLFGSQGVKAFDLEGKELWQLDLGVLDPGLFGDSTSHWGHASSPVIHGELVFLQVDRHRDSFLAAYDRTTGKQVWRVERAEKPTWATPTVHVAAGRSQLVAVGGSFDRGYDLATGRELWRLARDYEVKTTTPVVAGDVVILSGGYRGTPLVAVSVAAEGEVTEPRWTSPPGGPYTPTPVVYGERIFFPRNNGIIAVLALATGKELHRRRLGGTFSASPLASDGKIFLFAEGGTVTVVEATDDAPVLASVEMGEPLMATPAISDGTLFVRTRDHLWAVRRAEEPAGSPAQSKLAAPG